MSGPGPASGPVHDFRSDTVTRPDPEMRRRMAGAEVGDDVFGDDPTVRHLERTAAEVYGSEAALFVPSGTMGNQISIKLLTQPGDEILVEEKSHVVLYEGGGMGLISGVQPRFWSDPAGRPDPQVLDRLVRTPDVHHPPTTLLALENSHNARGGRAVPLDAMRAAAGWAHGRGLKVFLDGARLANAAVALGVHPREFVACADVTSTCLSKGLGCPVGSMLLSTAESIARARRLRKVLGGGMRQAGVLAAAGLLALERGFERLGEDHRRAKQLARGLCAAPGCELSLDEVDTNLVFVGRPARDSEDFVRRLVPHGILAVPFGPDRIRFVTHLDVDDRSVEAAIEAVHAVAAAG